jgi:hypothetical protein
MRDQVNAPPAPKRVPWNKGKLTGAKPLLRPKHSERNSRSKAALATLPCSILQSTASFAAVMSSPFGSRCRRRRVHGGSRNGPAKENRAVSQI